VIKGFFAIICGKNRFFCEFFGENYKKKKLVGFIVDKPAGFKDSVTEFFWTLWESVNYWSNRFFGKSYADL